MILTLVWGDREICEFDIQVSLPIDKNLVAVAYRLPQWDHHEERHFEHPFDEGSNHELMQEQEGNKDGKSFSVISTFVLSEAFSKKSGFVLLNSAIGVIFDLVHPFAPNRTMTQRKRYHRPSMISLKSSNFYLHSLNPLRIMTSLLICL